MYKANTKPKTRSFFEDFTEKEAKRLRMQTAVAQYYQQQHRDYHGWDHVLKMLGVHVTMFGGVPADDMFYAILFHDAVWLPNQSPIVEQHSADLFENVYRKVLNEKPTAKLKASVKRLILTTVVHKHLSDLRGQNLHADCYRILDLDLSAMASPWEGFLRTQEQLDREVEHLGTPAQRTRGAAQFLTKLIARGFIYYSPEMSRYNQLALSNVMAYISLIERRVPRSKWATIDRDGTALRYTKQHGLQFTSDGVLKNV